MIKSDEKEVYDYYNNGAEMNRLDWGLGVVEFYRTKEIIVEKAERALIGVDGRLMNSPVGPFKVGVEQEVINFIIPS